MAKFADEDLTIIVHRDGTDAEIFLSMPASSIKPILDKSPELIFNDNGRIPIDLYRVEGSFDIADQLFSGLTVSSGGRTLNTEAMSMMVHPKDVPVPFQTPLHGTLAVSICTTDYSGEGLLPDKVQLFYGAFARDIDPAALLYINLPSTERTPVNVLVHSYADSKHLNTERVVLSGTGALEIAPPQRSLGFAGLAAAILALLSAMGIGLILAREKFARLRRLPA